MTQRGRSLKTYHQDEDVTSAVPPYSRSVGVMTRERSNLPNRGPRHACFHHCGQSSQTPNLDASNLESNHNNKQNDTVVELDLVY